ncbi:conserved hypothetical protein [Ricinus communis]|uniref:RNase H type-1 domain-containing protein n=1 Tax=Ricinus communis TaxID=3988 RepID=B9SEK9_RICCO|nr:conserved hypothetical protein [Ricinus communis]
MESTLPTLIFLSVLQDPHHHGAGGVYALVNNSLKQIPTYIYGKSPYFINIYLLIVAKIIKIPLSIRSSQDSMTWHYHSSRQYTMGSGYFVWLKSIEQENKDRSRSGLASHKWKQLWKMKIPNKTWCKWHLYPSWWFRNRNASFLPVCFFYATCLELSPLGSSAKIYLDIFDALILECLALRDNMARAASLNWDKVGFKGDSLATIQMASRSSAVFSPVIAIMEDFFSYLFASVSLGFLSMIVPLISSLIAKPRLYLIFLR